MILKLLFSHLLGDYFLQSNYIAQNKGKDWYILFVHCTLYIVPFYLFFGYSWHLIVVFVLHVIFDVLKARYNATNIFVDQVIHYITLMIYFI